MPYADETWSLSRLTLMKLADEAIGLSLVLNSIPLVFLSATHIYTLHLLIGHPGNRFIEQHHFNSVKWRPLMCIAIRLK